MFCVNVTGANRNETYEIMKKTKCHATNLALATINQSTWIPNIVLIRLLFSHSAEWWCPPTLYCNSH